MKRQLHCERGVDACSRANGIANAANVRGNVSELAFALAEVVSARL